MENLIIPSQAGKPSLRLAQLSDGRKAIIIRTSDRINFKQCRRKWGWSSHLKKNLGPKYLAAPLWFGSGIHYALEDFHGWNKFERPSRAFVAYCIATAQQNVRDLPDEAQELFHLGIGMMNYYVDHWLRFRIPTKTFWCPPAPTGDPKVDAGGDGPHHPSWVPQVEVNFSIEIPLADYPVLRDYAKAQGADCVLYRGTIDRVGIDDDGYLWIVEYKTAKRAEHYHYQTDPQVTTYCWAGNYIYSRPVIGVKYYQYIKDEPKPPRILANGKLSTASNLVSSYPLYRSALERMYGSNEHMWPADNKLKLADIGKGENENKDRYIVRETVRRNNHMCEAEAQKILLEVEDMINPQLPLYPNPTRQCSWMCSFQTPCVTMDDGGDWEYELELEYSERDQDPERMWRRRLPPLDALLKLATKGDAPDILAIQGRAGTNTSETSKNRANIEAGEVDYKDFNFGSESPTTFSF